MSLLTQLQRRIAAIVARRPKGYEAYDGEGQPTIQSDLPPLDWVTSAMDLFRSKGRQAEKAALRARLERSEGPDNGGGRLYEIAAAMAAGPVKQPPASAPLGRRAR
jgi:hypothetical protein